MATNNSSMADNRRFIPWSWTVSPLEPGTIECDTPTRILLVFAIENIISSVLSLLVGHRRIINRLSCGLFGHPGSKAFRFTWVIPLGLHLGANAVIAAIFRGTPGYLHDYSIVDLMFFFTARPRLSTLVIGYANYVSNCWRARRGGRYRSIEKDRGAAEEYEGVYEAAFKSNMIAETVLLALATYPMGQTVRFYMQNWNHRYPEMVEDAKLLFVGSWFFIVYGAITLVAAVFFGLASRKWAEVLHIAYHVVWGGSWLFWVAYVRLAGDL
jgi:hypothetical protein